MNQNQQQNPANIYIASLSNQNAQVPPGFETTDQRSKCPFCISQVKDLDRHIKRFHKDRIKDSI